VREFVVVTEDCWICWVVEWWVEKERTEREVCDNGIEV
jgi:hypothetical protein